MWFKKAEIGSRVVRRLDLPPTTRIRHSHGARRSRTLRAMKIALLPSLAVAALIILSACGKQEPPVAAPAPAPAPAAVPAQPAAPSPAPAADNGVGKSVYNKVCVMCHAAGVAGAPKPGDKADWGPRIAQGTEVLYKHALEGFTGAKGMMPARGGGASLSDDEVKAAVDHMVAASR